jgi:hypothetical protein
MEIENSFLKLKKEIICQLKNSDWVVSNHGGFKNEYFKFEYDGDDWYILINLGKNGNIQEYKEVKLSDIMSILHFTLIKWIYVNRSLKNSKKREKIKEISDLSNEFFKYNKSIDRDLKINDILNK